MDSTRREEIVIAWDGETEAPETQEWRDGLTLEELDFVETLDKGRRRDRLNLCTAILIMDKIRARYGPRDILELKAAGDHCMLRLRGGPLLLARLDGGQELRLDPIDEVC